MTKTIHNYTFWVWVRVRDLSTRIDQYLLHAISDEDEMTEEDYVYIRVEPRINHD